MDKQVKVVKIISPYQVVLNCGLEDRISPNTVFQIYGLDDFIEDPDTGEILEQLELIRGTGRVVHVQQKICTVESNMNEDKPKTIKRTQSSQNKWLNPLGGETEETEIIRDKKKFDDVQIGDRARQLRY